MHKRKAVSILELIILLAVIFVLLLILLPSRNNTRLAAYVAQEQGNIRQILVAAHAYATENADQFPDTLADLAPVFIHEGELEIFFSSQDTKNLDLFDAFEHDDDPQKIKQLLQHTSFTYLKPKNKIETYPNPDSHILIYCDWNQFNPKRDIVTVGYLDGHITQIDQQTLKQQLEKQLQ